MDYLFVKIYLNFKKSYFSFKLDKVSFGLIMKKMQLFALVDKE